MARRVADALAACVDPVRVVVRPGAPAPVDLPRVEDRLPLRAALSGIHAALLACKAGAVLVAACDLPEIQPRLLLALLALTPSGDGAEVIVPTGPNGPEPLLAIYRPTVVPVIEKRVERGEHSLRGLLNEVRTLCVPLEHLRPFDPELRSFRNVNRPEDLRREG
jgi:molybdopterin-guanine dinucleotide biosynthesis protein A